MDTKAANRAVAANVRTTLDATPGLHHTITNTTDITARALNRRLNAETPFTCAELYTISRIAGTHPADFLAGAA
jgi:hypothetical protein